MDSVFLMLFLLFAEVVSGLIARMLPIIPRPPVQIGLGAVIGLGSHFKVELDAEIFRRIRERQLEDETGEQLIQDLDRLEARYRS
jgi:hypothetical protein